MITETRRASIEAAGYTLGRALGAGRFSQVVVGTHTSGTEYAVKIIEQASLEDDPEAREALQVEVAALKAADHPYVVRLYEVMRCPAGTYLVLELLTGGDLFDRIERHGPLCELDAAHLACQVGGALAHIHHLRLVHRDIKPDNIVFREASEGAPLGVKLIDFGFAAMLPADGQLCGLVGTMDFAAPEIVSWG